MGPPAVILETLGGFSAALGALGTGAPVQPAAFAASAAALVDQYEDALISKFMAARLPPERAEAAVKTFVEHAGRAVACAARANERAAALALRELKDAIVGATQAQVAEALAPLECDVAAAEVDKA